MRVEDHFEADDVLLLRRCVHCTKPNTALRSFGTYSIKGSAARGWKNRARDHLYKHLLELKLEDASRLQ